MDEVDSLQAVEFPHPSDDVREQKHSSRWKSDTSRQREIPKPLSLHRRIARAESSAVKRLNRKYRISHSRFREPIQRFRDEAPIGGITVVRVKRCEGQDVRATTLLDARKISVQARHFLLLFDICPTALRPLHLSHDSPELRIRLCFDCL
jgi:hypothetical protein